MLNVNLIKYINIFNIFLLKLNIYMCNLIRSVYYNKINKFLILFYIFLIKNDIDLFIFVNEYVMFKILNDKIIIKIVILLLVL